MNFLPKNSNYASRNKKKNLFLISIIVLFLVLILLNSLLRSFLFNIGKPIWNAKNGIVSLIVSNREVLKSKLSLISENNSLKEQIKNDEVARKLTDVIKKENEDLKSILNRNGSRYRQILSAVLVKPFLSPYDTLIIDVGSEDGVSVGDKVLANGNNFIGYIKEVYSNSSKVVLYSSYGEKVRVLIGQNYIEKEASGTGGGNFSVEMPKETGIKEGDPITIPSITYNIFAYVEKIKSRENDSFETVLFKSAVNINELKWVEVILSTKK